MRVKYMQEICYVYAEEVYYCDVFEKINRYYHRAITLQEMSRSQLRITTTINAIHKNHVPTLVHS